MNYRFESEIDGSLLKNMEQTNVGYYYYYYYYYYNDDPTLADNQFEILYNIINHNDFEGGAYSIILENFGYYVRKGSSLVLEPLYKGKWEFQVELSDGNEYSHTTLLRKPVTAGGYNFILEDIQITPMSSTIVFSYDSNGKLSDVFNAFSTNMGNLSVILSDGTILTKDDFSYSISSGSDVRGNPISAIVINITFNLPITAESVREFSILNETFLISNFESIDLP